ncbi:MAG: chorismate mutase [Cetobacterium sp.]
MIKITRDINKLREEIDTIDKKIVELILNRMDIVHQVGVTKSKDNSRIYVPEREVAIYKKLSEFSGLAPNQIQSFYTEIISFCRKLEGVLNVGIKYNALSLIGVKKIFGEYVNPIVINQFEELDLDSVKYILTPFSKEIIDFIKKNNWYLINKVNLNEEILYLFSSYNNSIFKDNDITYILHNDIISKEYIEIEQNLFINLILFKNLKDFENLNTIILGTIPSI